MKIAPATLTQIADLMAWLPAPSRNWVVEHAIERWHAEESAKRRPDLDVGGQEGVE